MLMERTRVRKRMRKPHEEPNTDETPATEEGE